MILESNNHSVFKLNYHLVLVTKYRRPVINDRISNRLKEIFEYIGDKYRIKLKEFNHDKDHIHVLFSAQPNSQLSKFINAYKSASSRLVKKEFPQIKDKLWKSAFWSKSYCLLTVGGAPLEVLKEYIKSQGRDKNVNNLQISYLPYERTRRKTF
ncbi:MAG: REP-associated tyrosine transposase [Thermoanaerobacter sp.]|uniref:Putative transposase n=1 Tax=Thermosipho japonicus TaxID=90323 RepID=A0A841GU58_9BACT|nr:MULTISPECIES: IS200/IS605 family transposase [Thermosipho]MBB6062131.1 putative transposase [Thermosipho japonicus]MDI3530044.1 REP-associated tyrosine transposase [Thermoanaerobacter sp.]MDK2900796.1 REP-associated tyrosine transposase [Thermosipho sp. (in: thermotogales)]